jgi:hypothetical protein
MSMLRVFACAKVAIVALILATPTAALAASAAQEISSYNKIKVEFTKNAQKCGFESLEPFERNLKNDLAAIGVNQNSESIVEIYLGVGAIAYGALDTQCAVDVSLDFRTTLLASNINTDNPVVRQAVDRLQAFPVSLYNVGAFAVSTTLYTVADGRNITKAEAEVIKIIGHLVKRFDEERKK